MKTPIVTFQGMQVVIFYNGSKIVEPIGKYKDMTKDEIIEQFCKERGVELDKE